jgi:hypothetical protein
MRSLLFGTVLVFAKGTCPDIAVGQYRGVFGGRVITVSKTTGTYTLGIKIDSEGDVYETDIEYSVAPDCSLNVDVLGDSYGRVEYDESKMAIVIGDSFALTRV